MHLQHVWDAPDAEFFAPGTSGVEINAVVEPAGDEAVVQKAFPNGFQHTDLEQRLRGADADQLVLCGMMTSMCVDATVRAAVDLGLRVHRRARCVCDQGSALRRPSGGGRRRPRGVPGGAR